MTEHATVRQNDPRASYHAYRAEIDAAWRRVMESGRYILGSEVESFEREFAAYLGVGFAVATASGTDALALALRAGGVGPGDAVLTVSHTAVATAAAIVATGARPLFVDIDPATFTMDAHRLEDLVRRHDTASHHADRSAFKAIIPVHLYGHAADMPAICAIAARRDLLVIEDCSQSHGAAIVERQTGTWGDLAAFSFYPTKNLGAFGDGGMIVTANNALADRCRSLRQYGWNAERVSRLHGTNSRLDEVQAAVLRVKLRQLDADNRRRAEIAAIYAKSLDHGPLIAPVTRAGHSHVYHQFVIRCPWRDRLREQLRERQVESAVHYPRAVHQHPAFQSFQTASDELAETERCVREVLSLPMYPQLSDADATRVAELINSLCARGRGK